MIHIKSLEDMIQANRDLDCPFDPKTIGFTSFIVESPKDLGFKFKTEGMTHFAYDRIATLCGIFLPEEPSVIIRPNIDKKEECTCEKCLHNFY